MGNRRLLGLIAGATLTIALTACGGSDDDKAGDATAASQATQAAAAATAPAPAAAATAATPAAPQAFDIRGGDFFFEPTSMTARAGTIVVTLQNVSDANRPHTFVVKSKSGDGDLAKTDRVSPGATGKVEFTISEPGTYEYYCNLPGHADRGQKGTLTVS